MQVSQLQNQDHNYNFQQLEEIRSTYEKSLQKCIQQKSKNGHLMSVYNQLSRKNNQLFQKVCKKLNQISKEIEIQTIELFGQKVLHKRHDAQDQFEQRINKQEYFFKIPNINIHIGDIGTPVAVSEVEKRIQSQMNEDRCQLQNEITKLKILIKLSQLNNQDAQSQNSKSQKSKH